MGSILPCCLPFGNAGELKILRCPGFEVKYYDFTLDALTLKLSDVCNVGVNSVPGLFTLPHDSEITLVLFHIPFLEALK